MREQRMMRRAVVSLGWAAAAALVATGVQGYTGGPADGGTHVLLGLLAALLVTFDGAWMAIYLLGTAAVLRAAVREQGLTPDLVDTSRALRGRCLPWFLAAVVLTVAAFLLGGALWAGLVPRWSHPAVGGAALLVQTVAVVRGGRALAANEGLLRSADRGVGEGVV